MVRLHVLHCAVLRPCAWLRPMQGAPPAIHAALGGTFAQLITVTGQPQYRSERVSHGLAHGQQLSACCFAEL